MRDALYLRAQAELCLRMADQISDGSARDKLRADAARYHEEAAEIENGLNVSQQNGLKASQQSKT